MVGFMCTPLPEAAPTSDGLARRLDIPICGRAVDDRRDAGGGSFGRDIEGGSGMLRFKLLGQLRHEFRAERVRAFDDKAIGFGAENAGRKCDDD